MCPVVSFSTQWASFPIYRVRIRLPRSAIFTTLPVCVPSWSHPTLYNPVYYSPPGSSVYGISQARILERVVISFSRRFSRPRDWTSVSCIGRPGSSPLRHVGFLLHALLFNSISPQSALPAPFSSPTSTLFFFNLFIFCCALFGSLLLWMGLLCAEWGILSSYCVWTSYCGGFSCWRAQALGTWLQ